jgi:hypothetical protein
VIAAARYHPFIRMIRLDFVQGMMDLAGLRLKKSEAPRAPTQGILAKESKNTVPPIKK